MPISEKKLFQREEYADELLRDGVVKIPFLTPEELKELHQFYWQMHPSGVPPALYDGIHMTTWHGDLDYKLKIKEGLQKVVEKACQRTFKNYRAISQQFIVKLKGDETTFPIHQDWSIVNESKYFSFNLWIPLQDVNESNGAMYIVKGSHRIDQKIRGAGMLFPQYFPWIDALKPFTEQFELEAGEALLFYHSTIHGSPFNQSDKPRIVVQVSILPEKAPLEIYFQKSPESSLEVHYPDDSFNFHYESLREESEIRPPTNQAAEIWKGFQAKEVSLKDIIEVLSKS
jgi:hypothetical protein